MPSGRPPAPAPRPRPSAPMDQYPGGARARPPAMVSPSVTSRGHVLPLVASPQEARKPQSRSSPRRRRTGVARREGGANHPPPESDQPLKRGVFRPRNENVANAARSRRDDLMK